MKVRDINYVEDDIIAGIESFLPDAIQYCNELQSKSRNITAAKIAKDELIKVNSGKDDNNLKNNNCSNNNNVNDNEKYIIFKIK